MLEEKFIGVKLNFGGLQSHGTAVARMALQINDGLAVAEELGLLDASAG